MKKLVLLAIAFISVNIVFAQDNKDGKKTDIVNRAGDHIVLQLSSDSWTGAPDSVKDRMKGLSRGANIYLMLDKPFRGNSKMSVAFGLGVGTSSIYFNNTILDIKSTNAKMPIYNTDSVDHFKKYKLTTAYLEVPLEFRFTPDPNNFKKSMKYAIGVKAGTLLNAHTKGKNLYDKGGKLVNSYTLKENSKRFFNSTRLAVTARVGYGIFSLFGSYQVNNMFKDGVAPDIKPLQIGLSISGL